MGKAAAEVGFPARVSWSDKKWGGSQKLESEAMERKRRMEKWRFWGFGSEEEEEGGVEMLLVKIEEDRIYNRGS